MMPVQLRYHCERAEILIPNVQIIEHIIVMFKYVSSHVNSTPQEHLVYCWPFKLLVYNQQNKKKEDASATEGGFYPMGIRHIGTSAWSARG